MDKYLVAESYQNLEQIGKPFLDEKGKEYINVKEECPRCSGLGFIVARVENGVKIPIPVDGGVCYKCGGEKTLIKKIRVYTEKEYANLQKTKARSRARKEEIAKAKKQDLIDNAAKYKHEIAVKLGFGDADETAYIVCGGDTFIIKDELKRLGAKFDYTLKWFFPSCEAQLPAGYKYLPVTFDEVYDYNPSTKWAKFKADAAEIIKSKINQFCPSTTEYYPAEEKTRIRNIIAKVTKISGYSGMYGYVTVYTFKSDNYLFVWSTTSSSIDIDIEVGDMVDLTGTIKKFDEYAGERTTYLNRCKIKELN